MSRYRVARAAIPLSNAPRYGVGGCDTRSSACVAIQSLYRDRGSRQQRCDMGRQRARARSDTTTAQQGTPATRPGGGHDTAVVCHDTVPSARCARGLGAVRTQGAPS